jgi:uncharacterized protein (DUF362 family)
MTNLQQADAAAFDYHPPQSALKAKRILVKPNLGYPIGPPVTVSMGVLGQVLRSLRTSNPTAEILIVEGVCSPVDLATIVSKNGLYNILDEGMRLLDADDLECIEYPNRAPYPQRFKAMWAPKLLQEVDCRISIGTFKRTILKDEPLISASLKNLYGLFPRAKYKARSANSRGQLHRPSVPQVLEDVYGCIGHLFNGAVVDANQRMISKDWKPDKGQTIDCGKVFFGDDLVAVDRLACEVLGEAVPDYLTAILLWRGSANAQ